MTTDWPRSAIDKRSSVDDFGSQYDLLSQHLVAKCRGTGTQNIRKFNRLRIRTNQASHEVWRKNGAESEFWVSAATKQF
jgi:hypothetical protein